MFITMTCAHISFSANKCFILQMRLFESMEYNIVRKIKHLLCSLDMY